MSLFLAHPVIQILFCIVDHVILNRGNHEDFAICTVYGFQLECCEKYGDVIFGLFVEIFQQLPLFAVVNQAVIVLHGGLFHTEDTTLAELDKIDRYVQHVFSSCESKWSLQYKIICCTF